MEKNKETSGGGFFVFVLIAVVLWIYCGENGARPAPDPPEIDVPTSCRPAIESIEKMTITQADARELAAFYEAFAATVERDTDNLLGTSESIRLSNGRCGKLCLSDKGIHGKYPGLSDLVDETIALSIGSKKQENGQFEPVTLDPARKHQLAQAIRGVASALRK